MSDNKVFSYAEDRDNDQEDLEPSVVPNIERPIDDNLPEYEPPQLDRQTSKNEKGVK